VVALYRDERRLSPMRLLRADRCATLVRGDVRDQLLVSSVLVKYDIDLVIHLAAVSTVGAARRDPWGCFDVNVMGTLSVLEACRRMGVPLVVQSSDKAYGARARAREADPLEPVGVYGASKACADIAARVYAEEYGLPVTVVRPSNVYGPGDVGRRIIPNTIKRCLRGERPVVYRNFPGVREYTYAEDLARAYDYILPRVGELRVVNVGSGEVRGQEEVVMEVLKHFPGLEPEYVDYSGREIPAQSLDSSLIRSLGWRPRVGFEEGVELTVEWWREIARRHPELLRL